MRHHHLLLSLCLIVAGVSGDGLPGGLGVAPAQAQETEIIGFRSPSGNIHCMFDSAAYDTPMPPSIRCDLREIEGAVPARPRDCDMEWGRSYSIAKNDAQGKLLCTGDAVFSDAMPTLDYGQTWQEQGFTCVSETSGLTCFNAGRHGFKLSKGSRTVF